MGYQEHGESLGDLIGQVREASSNLAAGEARTNKRIDELAQSINALYLRHGRPGNMERADDDAAFERKDAIGLCQTRRALTVPRIDAGVSDDYTPTPPEIDDALACKKAMRSLLRHGNVDRLDNLEKKNLSAFSFGGATGGFLLAPTMSDRVLRCIVDPTDVSGLVDRVNISSGSIKFLIDNSRMQVGGWACEASCFANNPQPDLQEGLGTLEIKAESLRFVCCATSDLLQDASFDVERWLMDKVSRGMRDTINLAVLVGDGVGRPLGFLNPIGGIPICDVSSATSPGQFTWQDLVMLKYEIPMQWQNGAVYLMNSRTAALLMTMSDTSTRPLFSALPEAAPAFTFAGSPIIVCSWMPDVQPGSTPVLFGNLKATYTLVDRRAVTMTVDPYSAGWCSLFKFDARVGGAVTCPNASRLLRIR